MLRLRPFYTPSLAPAMEEFPMQGSRGGPSFRAVWVGIPAACIYFRHCLNPNSMCHKNIWQ